jgi:serine/threonine-protein kinase
MGVVYRAFDTLLQRTVALKVIGGQIDSNPDTRARFLREARSAGQLSHKNIVTIYDLGEEDGHPFLAMEYLEGQDLQLRLCDPVKMDLLRKLDVALDLCEGLEFAHARGVLHRDVKPANIFITNTGEVKILDFGLARLITSQLTNSNMLMGTLNYIAPEQVRGDPADHRSDVFSVGVVIYELLGNKKAFEGDSFASTLYKILEVVPEPLWRVDATVPRALAAIVERALAKPLDQRFQSMAALRHELLMFREQLRIASSGVTALSGGLIFGAEDITTSLPIPSVVGSGAVHRPASASGPLSDPPARRRRRSHVAAGVIILLAVVTGAWFAMHRPSRPAPEPVEPAAAPRVDTSSTLGRAQQALQSHDYAGAEQAAKEVLQQSPGDASAQRILERARTARAAIESAMVKARSSLAAGDFQSASGAAGDVLTLAPEHAEARQIMAQGTAHAASRSVADARLRMTRARDQARAARAPGLAAPAYGAATRAEQVAEQLAATGRTADATARFYEASGLYQSAASIAQTRAQERSDADVTPTTGRSAAPPASSESQHAEAPPPAASPARPTTAESQPALPPITAPPPAPPPAPSPEEPAATSPSAEEGIGQLLAHYKSALEGRDLDALRKIWPGLTAASANAIGAQFRDATRLTVGILDPRISASGANGTVTFRRRYQMQTRDGQNLRNETQTTMTVRRTSAGWIIESIRFSPAR